MKINYITLASKELAARRYRMEMPGEYIGDYIVTNFPCIADVYVMGKAYTKDELLLQTYLARAKKLSFVFDLCDDIFDREEHDYYRKMIMLAEKVVVPTEAMREVVIKETGIYPTVIPDPYAFDEKPIKDISEPKYLWFGHPTNLKYLEQVKHMKLEVVTTDSPETRDFLKDYNCTLTEWSAENLQEAFDRNNVVLIPSDDSRKNSVKSNNRVIESIRQGMSVIAHPIPSYKEFDISFDFDKIKKTTPELQKQVRDNYNISVIGEKWKKTLSSTLDVAEGF